MANEYLHPFDVKRAHVLTRIVDKWVEDAAIWNVPFCPFYPTMQRKVKLMTRRFDPAGLASFHADNASTPVVKGGGEVEEIYMELVEISEKHVLSATDMIALESPDVTVSEGAARGIVKLAQQLAQRNIQRTKWMAWMAARDALTITYPDGGTVAVDFDLDATDQNDDFTSSHLPTAAAGWDLAATDVITDVYNWTKIIEDDLGIEAGDCIMHCNKAVWRYLKKNTGIKAELSTTNPRVITPRLPEVTEILEIAQIKVINDFYKLETSATTKYRFIPDGYVLITAPYVINGTPIMEMYDGPVVSGPDLTVARNPGAVAEIYNSQEQKAKNIRVSTARMPVMNYPAAFLYAQVY